MFGVCLFCLLGLRKLESGKGVCLNKLVMCVIIQTCIITFEIFCIVIVQCHVFFRIVNIKIYDMYDSVLLLYVESVQLYLK